jgi:hypothetical protein
MGASGQPDSKDAKKNQPQSILNIGGDFKGNIVVGNDNEISKIQKTEGAVPVNRQAKPKKEYGCQISLAIVVAVIGCIGAVTAAGVEPFTNWLLNRTPVATSTDVVATLAPIVEATDTAVDTQNPSCVYNHNCSVGTDWANTCIADYNWTVYSSSDFPELPKDQSDCYAQPILEVFYTRDNGLYILAHHQALTSSQYYGLFTPLPQSGEVSLSLDLDVIDNGQVWVGIFESPNPSSSGVMLAAPAGNVREQAFALKDMPGGKNVQISKIFQNPDGKYTMGFKLELGAIIANVEGISMTRIPFTPRTRWLFLGYRAKLDDPLDGTTDIQALFTNLSIR